MRADEGISLTAGREGEGISLSIKGCGAGRGDHQGKSRLTIAGITHLSGW